MIYRLMIFFLLLFFSFPFVIKAGEQSEVSAKIVVSQPKTTQEIPSFVFEMRKLEKNFKYEDKATLNLVKTAILVVPSPYRDTVIMELEKAFKIEADNNKPVKYKKVLEVIESISPKKPGVS